MTGVIIYFSILADTNLDDKMTPPEELARIFKCLSVSTRVRIVQLLKGRVMCVGALSRFLEVTPGAVSQHLRILREAGLVVAEKRGYFVHYRLNEKTMAKWRKNIQALLEPSSNELPCFDPRLNMKGKKDV